MAYIHSDSFREIAWVPCEVYLMDNAPMKDSLAAEIQGVPSAS